jgi:hypothetical protein
MCAKRMTNLRQLEKRSYTNVEVAELLGIPLETLHQLLRVKVFPEDAADPATIRFLPQDIVMIECWLDGPGSCTSVPNPKRLH